MSVRAGFSHFRANRAPFRRLQSPVGTALRQVLQSLTVFCRFCVGNFWGDDFSAVKNFGVHRYFKLLFHFGEDSHLALVTDNDVNAFRAGASGTPCPVNEKVIVRRNVRLDDVRNARKVQSARG